MITDAVRPMLLGGGRIRTHLYHRESELVLGSSEWLC